MQFAKFGDPFGREKVNPGGEDLPQFDEGGAEPLQRADEGLRPS